MRRPTIRSVAAPLSLLLLVWTALSAEPARSQSPPRTPSEAIRATAGQVIQGVKITSATGPCIAVDNVANVWIDNVELGPCGGNGVRITGAGATNIRITNSIIHTEGSGKNSGVGVYINSASDVLIQGNQLLYNESSVYAVQASNIRVIGNYSLNPLGPMPRGQHVQFNNVVGGEISDNYGESRTANVLFQPVQEDAVNLFQSRQIIVRRNYLVGGLSGSGCGIVTDGGGADANNVIADNTVIRTAQCGIGIAGGTNHVVTGNKVLDTNIPAGSGNMGLYVWNQYRTPCSGMRVESNIVSNLLPGGNYNDFWDAGNCGPVILNNNTFGSAARALLTPEAEKLPPPPIPPLPYVPGG